MTHPFLVNENPEDSSALTPLPAENKYYQEVWLQRLLHAHPDVLPVQEVDERYGPPVSIGREIAAIDNLFVSPQGEISIVETKLWRNPEAHRTVVAQILDYTSTLVTWTYDELDTKIKACRTNPENKSMYELVKAKAGKDMLDETDFRANVTDCLMKGRFNLMVVGDRIRPEATQLAELIQTRPGLHYTMSFVQLTCYRLSPKEDWPLLVVPTFVQRTREMTRAVVKVIYEDTKPTVEISTPEKSVSDSSKITKEIFVGSVPSRFGELFQRYIDSWLEKGYKLNWGVKGFTLVAKIDDKPVSLFYFYPDTIGIVPPKWKEKYQVPSEPYGRYAGKILGAPEFSTVYSQDKQYVRYDAISSTERLELLLEATSVLADELAGL